MQYVPALDGLRAIAVLAVVAFHADIGAASGGFLGVSLFFTLSGFLITTLLLHEHDSTGTVSLRRFYERRARRLLPAAYLCLALVVVVVPMWSVGQRQDLGGDVVASVLNVANWRFAFSSTTYAELLATAPSPVAHFWSLSIEEQIYVILPLVVVVALRRGRSTLIVATTALLAASVAATLLTTDRDLVYNGTHTRAGELLIGVLLAIGMRWTAADRRRSWTAGSGAVASAGFVIAVGWASIDQAWLYDGGLVAVGLLSAVLIVAVMDGRFPARLLELPALVAIGRVSYGIYLFHWPVFVLLDPERVGLDGPALLVVRCAVTAVLTVVSAAVLERPIRAGTALTSRRAVTATLATGGAIVIVVATASSGLVATSSVEEVLALGEAEVVRFGDDDTAAADDVAADSEVVGSADIDAVGSAVAPARANVVPAGGNAATAPPTTVPDVPAGPVVVVGSDTATAAALGERLDVIDLTEPGCPINDVAACAPLAERVATALHAHRPVAVVVAVGTAEQLVAARSVDAIRSPADVERLAAAQEAMLADLRTVVRQVSEADASLVFHTSAAAADVETFHQLGQVTLEFVELGRATTDVEALAARVDSVLRRADEAVRTTPRAILVIGDSTSLSLAQALDEGADGQLTVTWAGSNGCPLVAVEAVRPDPDGSFIEVDCPDYPDKIGPLLDELRPDAVLVMSGSMELAEHRFAGDDASYDAGTIEFLRQRAAVLDRLLDTVGPTVPLLVADMPAVTAGWYASLEMLDSGRLETLNGQIADWDASNRQVERFDYRRVLEEHEAANGSIRSDGVHPDVQPFVALARAVLVDQLIEQIDRLAIRQPVAE